MGCSSWMREYVFEFERDTIVWFIFSVENFGFVDCLTKINLSEIL